MIDYYKILSLTFGASDTEIKKQYRKLASIYHPDKNGGSKKSEEAFKVIANAYQTLSNKQSRAVYDLKYKQHFKQTYSERNNQTKPNDKQEFSKYSSPRNREYRGNQHKKSKTNFSFFLVILLILLLIYFFNSNKSTTTVNPKADEQLEQQNNIERPESGELDF